MKLAALILLFAFIGKMSAVPSPYRLAYYRAEPQQQLEEASEEEADDETEISQEDFSNNGIQAEIQDDDDDSDEQETPPEFSKLFPLPQRNSPGHNFPLAVMMGGISAEGWNVPKAPIRKNQQRARNEFELARDDDEDDEDSDEDEEDEEEDDEPEDDLPDWQSLFPNVQDEAQGPPQGIVDSSSQPEIPAAFRSGLPGGSRVVYIPARALRGARPVQSGGRQYVMRSPAPQRSQVMYGMIPSNSQYIRRQPVMQSRPQYVIASPSAQRRPQYVMASPSMQRRPQQQGVYYMPVRRNSYNPYVSPYVPRYRYY